MIKKRRNLFIMLVVIVLVLSATVGAIVASSNGTRFNNTILASSVAAVSSSGLLTVTNQYQGISGKTTKGEITTYIEKKTWGLFWKRVDIGEPNLILFVPDNSYCLVCNTREGQGFAITWRSPVAAYSF